MIKVTCKDSTDLVKSEYPCLKISDGGRIVAFISPDTGHELRGAPGDDSTLFYHSQRWCEKVYKPYPGIVELSNEL